MCRLFGLTGGDRAVRATFWLLEAPDSLARQSRREPDGTGVGWFGPDGRPEVAKQPLAAYADQAFAREARELESTTFVAHIRYATTGTVQAANTHPFAQRGRLMAHNGVVQDLPRLERELGDDLALVQGDTDSERLFALITREIGRHDGDVGAGIASAARWVAAHLPVYALNLVLATPAGLWALRYPAVHELWVLRRAAGGARGDRHLDAASAGGTVRVRSAHLSRRPAVIVASEPMDADPGWRLLEPGELLHVDHGLAVRSTIAVPEAPARPLTLGDLDEKAAAAQAPRTGAATSQPREPA
ncbi:class II glutamine amidotransferase [Baekduia soli]|uniref:Class II glutamine amidotransferase n=1 Tax=Baekduia soli TaxID=496014 RepID=A0A5B8U3C4_9ACTN|nr:class II glutamine amidotransferase [Baekduia soli]QEC47335.1 class II glutamine amidotransferase [Baekduia soli]